MATFEEREAEMEREERGTMSARSDSERLTAHDPNEDDMRIVEGEAK